MDKTPYHEVEDHAEDGYATLIVHQGCGTHFMIRDDMPLTLQRDMLEDQGIDLHAADLMLEELIELNPKMHWHADA